MTTYTAIPNGDIDPDSPITTGLVTLLRDNPIAITEGSTGAPKLQTAAYGADSINSAAIANAQIYNAHIHASALIATSKLAEDNGITIDMLGANSVGQSEVETNYQQLSGTQDFTATGAAFCMGHTMDRGASGANVLYRQASTGSNTVYNAFWYFSSAGGGDYDDVRLYYVESSPPYDLGDGEIPLFVYALVKNGTGEVVRTNMAPDPIWAYNGPTDISNNPIYKNGKKYLVRKDLSAIGTLEQAKVIGPGAVKDWLQASREVDDIHIELTQAIKNADMDLIPHPWGDEVVPGHSIIMLDPMSDFVRDLHDLHKQSERCTDIVKNYINIGNSHITGRKGPKGLMMVSASWKNTR